MKLLMFPAYIHDKNMESMERMCKSIGWEYERTEKRSRLEIKDYDILWLPLVWLNPDEFPNQKILYGPHFFVFPEGNMVRPRVEEWSKRCVYTCLSDWVLNTYKEFTNDFVIPFAPLPMGVRLLEPRNPDTTQIDCIIYIKRRNAKDVNFIEAFFEGKNISTKIFIYGSYNQHEYQESLKKTKFAIWLGTHESQGFALQECLSRNIPILVCDAYDMFFEMNHYNEPEYKRFKDHKKLLSTTVPYWDNRCGIKIQSMEEFEVAFNTMQRDWMKFNPRQYIEETLNDKTCMMRILNTLNISLDS
jgi:hypothetical protein